MVIDSLRVRIHSEWLVEVRLQFSVALIVHHVRDDIAHFVALVLVAQTRALNEELVAQSLTQQRIEIQFERTLRNIAKIARDILINIEHNRCFL